MKKLLLLLPLLIILLSPQSVWAGGFGVSPPRISEDNLVPGISFKKTIYLVQGAPDRDLTINTEIVTTDSIAEWVSFDVGDTFVIPSGVQQFPVEVRVDVPEDTPLNIYEADLRFVSVPESATGAGEVAIALAAKVDLDLVVGDNVISEYEVPFITIEDIFEGDKGHARLKIRNTGNVPAAPTRASFELFNKFGDIRLSYSETDKIEPVPAYEEAFSDVYFPFNLSVAPGEYWGQIRVYDDAGEVAEERTVFLVHEKTFMQKNLTKLIGGGVAAVVLLALIIILLLRRRNKKRRRSRNNGA